MEASDESMNFTKRDLEHLETARKVTDSRAPRGLDDTEDQRILRKIDWHLIPFVSFLYLLSFL